MQVLDGCFSSVLLMVFYCAVSVFEVLYQLSFKFIVGSCPYAFILILFVWLQENLFYEASHKYYGPGGHTSLSRAPISSPHPLFTYSGSFLQFLACINHNLTRLLKWVNYGLPKPQNVAYVILFCEVPLEPVFEGKGGGKQRFIINQRLLQCGRRQAGLILVTLKNCSAVVALHGKLILFEMVPGHMLRAKEYKSNICSILIMTSEALPNYIPSLKMTQIFMSGTFYSRCNQ